jgi:pentose-5-phosphate-3-epimerase
MLIEPGTRDTSRLDRLDLVTACTTQFSDLPVAVDGGITEEVAPLCAASGIRQMVVGRALLTSERREAI